MANRFLALGANADKRFGTHPHRKSKRKQSGLFYLNGTHPDIVHNRALCNCDKQFSMLTGIFDGFENVGANAAYTATTLLAQMKFSCEGNFAQQMESFLLEANMAVCAVCKEKTRPGGSTATIAWISKYRVQVCNLGDSPGYLFHGGKLSPLYVADNEIAYGAVISNRLNQYLGMDTRRQPLQPHFAFAELSRRDRLLFCSDGLTAELSQAELEAALAMGKSPEDTAELLLSQVLVHGGRDNITILVINIS